MKSEHVLHVVVELSYWNNADACQPVAALAHIKDAIESHLEDKFEFDPIEDTGMLLEGIKVI